MYSTHIQESTNVILRIYYLWNWKCY